MRFSSPWLLLAAAPFVLFALLRLRRWSASLGRRRRPVQLASAVGVVCAALALGGLEVGHRLDRLAVVFALDRSRSVDLASGEAERALAEMRAAVEWMRAADRAGVVAFGADAATEVLPSPRPPVGQHTASVGRDATDIERALRRALADLPAGYAGRVVLISDGVQTRGDALAAATLATARGVTIDVLALRRSPAPEVAVERVRVPDTARPGEPVEVRVVTRATDETPARVRVLRDGRTLAETETTLRAGSDVLVLRDEAPEAGLVRYDVLVQPLTEGTDVGRANNEGGAFMRVVGHGKVLVVADEPPEAQALASVLDDAGLRVTLVGPERFPIDLGEMAGYDLLVLSDVSSRAFTEAQLRALGSYVRDLGGGLLMVGARRSFGLGGYAHTPVEAALPATFDLRRHRERLSLAMILAIDNSGSMGAEVSPGRSKLDLANEAAARSAAMLSPRDRVGVMHVDTDVQWTQPMISVSDPAQVAAAVRRAAPGGGGILVDITLDAAYAALRHERTQLKHLLLFSDGSDSEQMGGCRAVVAQAARDGITTSIVSMGVGPDTPELERLSQIGGGRFYIVEDLRQLPRIFTQETLEASRAALVEEPFRPTPVSSGPPIRGIDFAAAPELGGHAVVNARPRATVLLRGKDEEDPLLLTWQHGVGRGGVFATDVGAEFARPWLSWPGYATLFGQLARDLARAPERGDAHVSIRAGQGVGRILVEAVDGEGRVRNYLDLRATVAAPGGRSVEVALTQTGPGRYEGTFDADAPGAYLATVRDAESGGMVGSAGVVRPSGDELSGEGTDHALLGQLAALTGGRVRTSLRDVFVDRPPPTWAYEPLWRHLLALALLALLASVAARRLVLPSGLWRRLWPSRRREARSEASEAASVATVDVLVASKRERRRPPPEGELPPEPAILEGAAPEPPPASSPPDDLPPAAEASPAAPDDTPPEEGASLAEKLLAQKKRRR